MLSLNHIICWFGLVACTFTPAEALSEVNLYESLPEAAQEFAHLYENHPNPSRAMAQIEQESSWNPYALSRTGAQGHAQIMPATGKWGARSFARHLGRYSPHDPYYAAEFHKSYMGWFSVHPADNYCDNQRIDEARYNGGFYIIWEWNDGGFSLAGAQAICGVVRLSNGRLRSISNCLENYGYYDHISRRQPKYLSMGGTYCPRL